MAVSMNLLTEVECLHTFFFCFRHASHPRPEGTPGISLLFVH
jgi:hypothetical protein